MKRLIGKHLIDEKIEKSRKYWTFNFQANNEGKPFVLIPKPKDSPEDTEGLVIHPEEVSAAVLKKIVDVTAKTEGFRPIKAVITVPAYFNQVQKQATMDAGRLAGLEVLQLVTEPAAAAYAFTFDRDRFDDTYHMLVYDFGGGELKIKNYLFARRPCLSISQIWRIF